MILVMCANCSKIFSDNDEAIAVFFNVKSEDNLEEEVHPELSFCSLECAINHLTGINNGNLDYPDEDDYEDWDDWY